MRTTLRGAPGSKLSETTVLLRDAFAGDPTTLRLIQFANG